MNYITSAVVGLLGVMLVFGYILSRRSLLMPRMVTLKGMEFMEFGAFVKLWKKQFGKSQYGIRIHPELPLPQNRENENFFIAGAIGSGKTVGVINYVLKQLIDDFRAGKRKDKIILYDIKGDYTSQLYGTPGVDVKILAPWDRRSVRWALEQDIRTIMDAGLFSKVAIPDKPNAKDPFWDNAARKIIEQTIACLWSECGSDSCSWMTVNGWLSDIERLRILLQWYAEGMKAYITIAGDTSQTQGILSNLYQGTAWLDYLCRAWGHKTDFSLRSWLDNKEPGILILRNNESYPHIAGPLITLAYQLLMQQHLARGEGWKDQGHGKIWYIIDEFPSLPKIPGLIRAIPTVRSLGGCFVLAAQDISQLESTYGREDAQTIAGQCATRVFFRLDGSTAEWASDLCGNKEEAMSKHGHWDAGGQDVRGLVGYRIEDNIKTVPVIQPGEFQALRRADQLGMATEAMLQVSGMPITRGIWPLTLLPRTCESDQPAEWVQKPLEPRKEVA